VQLKPLVEKNKRMNKKNEDLLQSIQRMEEKIKNITRENAEMVRLVRTTWGSPEPQCRACRPPNPAPRIRTPSAGPSAASPLPCAAGGICAWRSQTAASLDTSLTLSEPQFLHSYNGKEEIHTVGSHTQRPYKI
jgi:hypothetical protein